jgi:hypothetical protein
MVLEGFPVQRGDRERAALSIVRVFPSVVRFLSGTFQSIKDKLADGHPGVDPYGVNNGDFQCPVIAKAYISFTGGGMNLDA